MHALHVYSGFFAARIMSIDDSRVTPHLSAIACAGPLVRPMLAAQLGYAPGLIWLADGCW